MGEGNIATAVPKRQDYERLQRLIKSCQAFLLHHEVFDLRESDYLRLRDAVRLAEEK